MRLQLGTSARGNTLQRHAPLAAAACTAAIVLARAPPAFAGAPKVDAPRPLARRQKADDEKPHITEEQYAAIMMWQRAWQKLMESDKDTCADAAGMLVMASTNVCDAGQYEDGLQGFDQALKVLTTLDSPKSQTIAYTHECRAVALAQMGRQEEAVQSHRQGLQMRRDIGIRTKAAYKGYMNSAMSLAMLQSRVGDVSGAADTMREVLAVSKGEGKESQKTIERGQKVLAMLEQAAASAGAEKDDGKKVRNKKAKDKGEHTSEEVKVDPTKLDPGDIKASMTSLHEDIQQLKDQGKPRQNAKKMAELWDRATIAAHFQSRQDGLTAMRALLPLSEAQHGKGHPAVAARSARLATVLSKDGQHDEALRLWRGAVRDLTAKLGPEHGDTLKCRCSLGNALLFAEQFDAGEAELRAVLPKLEAKLGKSNEYVVDGKQALAHQEMKRFESTASPGAEAEAPADAAGSQPGQDDTAG